MHLKQRILNGFIKLLGTSSLDGSGSGSPEYLHLVYRYNALAATTSANIQALIRERDEWKKRAINADLDRRAHALSILEGYADERISQ
jgi:hypothetical protein